MKTIRADEAKIGNYYKIVKGTNQLVIGTPYNSDFDESKPIVCVGYNTIQGTTAPLFKNTDNGIEVTRDDCGGINEERGIDYVASETMLEVLPQEETL